MAAPSGSRGSAPAPWSCPSQSEPAPRPGFARSQWAWVTVLPRQDLHSAAPGAATSAGARGAFGQSGAGMATSAAGPVVIIGR